VRGARACRISRSRCILLRSACPSAEKQYHVVADKITDGGDRYQHEKVIGHHPAVVMTA
jgi:DUF971 family protein